MFSTGDVPRALGLFLRSNQIYPSRQNSFNAALCLHRLERYDEALTMYERLLTELSDQLSPKDRALIRPKMTELRNYVGSIWISANVDGLVVIDGRGRGKLPLTNPIRVLPGRRTVRILKDGYEAYEQLTPVKVGQTVRIDARLVPLAEAGMLRIEDRNRAGSQVYVDGAPMGVTPWQGTLGPGKHVVWTRMDDLGSAPQNVVVVQGQTAVVELRSQKLGPSMSIDVMPRTAQLAINGAPVGQGRWHGRLPLGEYTVAAWEAGYHEQQHKVLVRAEPQRAPPLNITLEIDPDHPRWPQPIAGRVNLEAFAGYAFGVALRSGAEGNCLQCPDNPGVHGMLTGLTGAYRFPFGLSLELSGGYMRLSSSFQRVAVLTDEPGVSYGLDDTLLVHGPFAAFGLGYHHPLSRRFGMSAHLAFGALVTAATDDIEANARREGHQIPATVVDHEPIAYGASAFAQADVAAELSFGDAYLALALGLALFPTDGPMLDGRSVSIPNECYTTGNPAGCIRSGAVLDDEPSHRMMLLGFTQLRGGYSF